MKSEVIPLRWSQVDFEAGTVRLEAGTTKNGEARVFLMTAELRAVLKAQRADTDAVSRERRMIIPWVFHRDGRRMRDFRRNGTTRARERACRA